MRKIIELISMLLMSIMLVGSVSLCVFAEQNETGSDSAQLSIGIKNELDGQTTPDNNVVFSFNITSDDEKSPMPKDTNISVVGAGNIAFDSITYDTPGIYYYTVTPEKGNNKNVTYDLTPYDVAVVVKNVDSTPGKGLVAYVAAVEDLDSGKKVDTGNAVQSLVFNNIIRISGDSGSGDGSGFGDPGTPIHPNPFTGALGGPIFSLILLIVAAAVMVLTVAIKKKYSDKASTCE